METTLVCEFCQETLHTSLVRTELCAWFYARPKCKLKERQRHVVIPSESGQKESNGPSICTACYYMYFYFLGNTLSDIFCEFNIII